MTTSSGHSPGVPGLTSLTRDSTLLDRAREFLATGPADPVPLIEYVCRLPGAPRVVAEHMAVALFERDRRFRRDGEGRWLMVRDRPAPRSVLAAPGKPRRIDEVSFVVVDVETTGTRVTAGDRVTEVAAVTVQRGRIVDVYETLVNPERSIPSQISALTRITSAMVCNAPTFRDIAHQVAEVLDGRLFVAHNAGFDWRFLSQEMARATGARLEGERLCTVRLARALLPQVRRRSLDFLSYYYGIENPARHRAGGDAVATAHVLIRLLQAARSQGLDTLEHLRGLTRAMPARRRRRRRMGLPQWGDGDLPT
jgi:DNA polymerase-3 subunit epsilon